MLKVIGGGIADSGGSFYLNICNIILIFSSYLRKIIDYITDISLKKITSVIALVSSTAETLGNSAVTWQHLPHKNPKHENKTFTFPLDTSDKGTTG